MIEAPAKPAQHAHSAGPRAKRQWTSKADRFAMIAGVLREFCCYASVADICSTISASGRRAHHHRIVSDLLELTKAGVIDRTGDGHKGSPYLYCLMSDDIPAPAQVFNPLPPPDPAVGGRARAAVLAPEQLREAGCHAASKRWQNHKKVSIEQVKRAIESTGSKGAAAKLLGVSTATIHNRLREEKGLPPYPSQRDRVRSARGLPPCPSQRAKPLPPPAPIAPPPEPPRAPPHPRPEHTPPPAGPEGLALLWARYRADSTSESLRNALMEHYLPLVRRIAFGLHKKTPDSVEFDDLITEGCLGLSAAIAKFDPDRGLKFETYAPRRIHGEMLDYLRKMDWVPRLVRAKASKLRRATQQLDAELGREPSTAELSRYLSQSIAETEEMITESRSVGVISINKKTHRGGDNPHKEQTTEDSLIDRRAAAPSRRHTDLDRLRELCRGLNKQERLVVICYYWLGETMKEIGRQLDLSESRVSQMHSRLIIRLQARFNAAPEI